MRLVPLHVLRLDHTVVVGHVTVCWRVVIIHVNYPVTKLLEQRRMERLVTIAVRVKRDVTSPAQMGVPTSVHFSSVILVIVPLAHR